jgi:hypothetical protein
MRLRHHWITRAVAIAFLLWTGVDLAAASVCSSEGARSPLAPLACGVDSDRASAPNSQVDDCFCCCPTASPAGALQLFHVSSPTQPGRAQPFPVRVASRRPLDHPPQA